MLGLSSIYSASSWADIVEYGDFTGASVEFIAVSEVSDSIGPGVGQVSDLFGAPVISGDTLVLTPEQFDADQSGLGTSSLDSQLTFQLEAQAGFEIVEVIFSEFGNYSLTTPFATGQAGVGVVANGFVTTDAATTDESFTFSTSQTSADGFITSGVWDESFSIGIDPASSATVVLNNTLLASAFTAADTGVINKAGVTIEVVTQAASTTAVPEPSSLGLVVMTAAGLVIRRKRRS